MARRSWALLLLLALTVGIKQAFAGRPARPDDARLERDLVRVVAPSGYRLARVRNGIGGYALRRGACHAGLAPLDLAGSMLARQRGLMRGFDYRAEYFGESRVRALPAAHWIGHYAARTLARIGIDRPATPYVLLGWDKGCPAPARGFGGVRMHYRRG